MECRKLINWTSYSYKDKQTIWRDLRNKVSQDISLVSTELNIPYSQREIDFYTPTSWPSPWELLEYKTLCRSCIGLFMYYTIEMSTEERPELLIIDDNTDRFLVTIVKDKVFNLFPGKIGCPEDLNSVKLVHRFSAHDIKKYK